MSSNCEMKGFRAHHPRNCFYYLRDFPFERIKKSLKDSHETFDEVTSDEVEDYYDYGELVNDVTVNVSLIIY